MSKKEVYEQKTEEILNPIVEKHGFDLWDVEYVKEGGNWYLRAYIDKPGGIMVDDCEVVSRELSDILDEKDFIDEAYILEVSSTGLGIAFYKKGWQKTVSFTYNKQDCFDIEKGRNKRKVTGYRKCESLSF